MDKRKRLLAVGLAANPSQSRTACDDGSPANPPRSATVSHPSRSSRSLTAATTDYPEALHSVAPARRG